tara:strand:+ start:170 stop:544 length:375 start_codon:yes stop_codon:yes gene_type:complete
MKANDKLYETFGELLYAIAKTGEVIKNKEMDVLDTLLKSHPWAKEIKWYFNYEFSKNSSVEDIYNKVINYCQSYGPSIIYPEFIDSMRRISKATNGIDGNEQKVISDFSKYLITRLQNDLDKIG